MPPYDGVTGTYSPPSNSWNPAVDNTDISTTDWAAILADLSTALSTTITKDGQTTPTANIPLGGYKLTGIGNGAASTDAANLGQVQNNTIAYVAASGSADAITAVFTPTVTALTDGMLLRVKAGAANATTTPTFSPDSLSAHTITKLGGQALAIGDIFGSGHELQLQYSSSGTRWELLNPASSYNPKPAWTPVDASGAALSLTVNGAGSIFLGTGYLIWADISFPVTADTSNVTLGGLPGTILNTTGVGGSFTLSGAGGGTDFCLLVPNSTTFQAYTSAGSHRTNAQYSNTRIRFQFFYPI